MNTFISDLSKKEFPVTEKVQIEMMSDILKKIDVKHH
jgi:hypothetical protein